MAKANKVGEGLYRTDDQQFQISVQGDQHLVSELRSGRYVVVATAKTLAQAEKELTRVTKTEEEVPEVEVTTNEEE